MDSWLNFRGSSEECVHEARFPIYFKDRNSATYVTIRLQRSKEAPISYSFVCMPENRYLRISVNLQPQTSGRQILDALTYLGETFGKGPIWAYTPNYYNDISGASLGLATAMAYIGAPTKALGRKLVYTGELRKDTSNPYRVQVYPIKYLANKLSVTYGKEFILIAPSASDGHEGPATALKVYEPWILDENEWAQGEKITDQKYICALADSVMEACALIQYPNYRRFHL